MYRTHERMLAELGVRDGGDLVRDALRRVREQPAVAGRFEHLLVDDAQELDLGPARLALEVGGSGLTAAGDPIHALRRFRGAGAVRMAGFERAAERVIRLTHSLRCPERVVRAARRDPRGAGRSRRPARARSRSGGVPTTARRRSRWPPRSSA